MRKATSDRARARGIGSGVRALVAAATAVLGVSAALLVAASPAGAATFASNPVSVNAGESQTITLNGVTSGDSIQLNVSGTGTPDVSGNGPVTATGTSVTFTLTIFTVGSWSIQGYDTTLGAITTSDEISVTPDVLKFVSPPSAVSSTSASFDLTVDVEDSHGNVISTNGDDLALQSSTNDGCQLSGATGTVTASSGSAQFTGLTLTGYDCVITATDTTSTNDDTTFVPATTTISVVGAPAQLAFSNAPATAIYGTATQSITLSVEDSHGIVESATGGTGNSDTIDLTSNCAFTTNPATLTASSGAVSFTVTFTGTVTTNCTLSATDHTRSLPSPSTWSVSIAVSTNTAAKLGFTTQPPTTATAGVAFSSFAVSTEVGNGSATGTGSDVISLTSSCKLSGVTSVAETAGVATFSDVIVTTASTCTLIATDSTNSGIASATSNAVIVTAGTPTHVAFTTAPPTTFGSLTAPLTAFKVSVEDVYGNVATTTTGSTDTIEITSTNCTLTGTTSVVAVAGVATFSAVTVTTPGTCVLTASDVTRPMTTAQATVMVGQPQPTLVVSSTSGNLDTPLTLKTTGGAGTGAVTYSVVDGTAQGCAIVNGALKTTSRGTCIVTATKAASGTYASATSAATTVTIGAPLPKAFRVVGAILWGHQLTVTVTGRGFYGRPRVISNARGFSVRIARDSGSQLRLIVYVSPDNRAGVHVLTIIEPNGKRTSVRYVLRG